MVNEQLSRSRLRRLTRRQTVRLQIGPEWHTGKFDHDILSRPATVDERRAAGVHRLIVEFFDLSNVDDLISSYRISRPTAKPMGIAAEFRWYGIQSILTKILGQQQRYRDIGGQDQEQQDRQLINRHYGEPNRDERH